MFKRKLLGVIMAVAFATFSCTAVPVYAASEKSNTTTENTKGTETTTTENANSTEEDTETVGSDKSIYKLKIGVSLAESGWYNDSTEVKVTVTPLMKYSNFKIDTVEAKAGSNGTWTDITDDMTYEITENCTVYVKVTDENGAEYEKSRYFKCFDTVAPTLNAAVSEGLLTVLTYDTESGIKDVYVNEYSFTPDDNGIVKVRLSKFDASYQNFYIYAIDNAGNSSTVYTVANPYYKEESSEDDSEDSTENPAASLPDTASASVTNQSSAAVTSVTDEDGKDISEEVNTKQFYTIVTKDGQQYFLVIDMSAAYTDDDGVDTTGGNGTVYFLTSVSNENLLNFVDSDEETLPHNSVAEGNNINTEEVTPDLDESTTETATEEIVNENTDSESKGLGNWLYVIIFGIVAVIVIFVKMCSGKKGKPDTNDDSMYDAGGIDDGDEDDYGSEADEEEE